MADDMVIVQLLGGLGNQLIQYAVGCSIAHRNNSPLKLDISQFDKYPERNYSLNCFNISASIASPAEVSRFTTLLRKDRLSKVIASICRKMPYYRRTAFFEKTSQFNPKILRASGNIYLIGYWQSEKYFTDIEKMLRDELAFKHNPDSDNSAMVQFINQTDSVSLHIRRGDYVDRANKVHGICSLDYYKTAIETLPTSDNPHFFVFSDDIEWATQNLKLNYPVTFVSHNGIEKDYEDLRLMSHCKNHIIANSSFSWWGAWLCANPEKVIIAPKKWFNDPNRDTKDLIPHNWIRV